MRSLLLLLGVFVFGFNATNASAQSANYKATITNLTVGQVMTPPVLVVHKNSFSLFTLGEEASAGLQILATTGNPVPLTGELDGADGVNSYAIGTGIMPGESLEIEFSAAPNSQVSLASMLAVTNDAFVSQRGLSLNIPAKHSQTTLLHVFDAGAEVNDESCDNVPGCGMGGTPEAEEVSFVHFHPGLHLQDDLSSDSLFANVAAKITIERIK